MQCHSAAGLWLISSGIAKTRCTGVPFCSGKSVAKHIPRAETFKDSADRSGAADFGIRTQRESLKSNRVASRLSIAVIGTKHLPKGQGSSKSLGMAGGKPYSAYRYLPAGEGFNEIRLLPVESLMDLLSGITRAMLGAKISSPG